ncbi:hypothetical protein Cgig2_014992 [Carnegiea gigantea]|uniref:Uncharacterized protein n=1 Tax=Carnegiea gigantea TaxID=171969 RepID=A0A9Q1KK27_9CARY|nr:hypothetical protein Cgig2_014992 [Carnegiea gigantea]
MSPKRLRQLIEKLNDKQKEAIKEIGFGGFLYLKVDMIPGKLALQLVRDFNTCSCSLPLTHGRLRVIEHDVYMTLALPKGPLMVTKAKNEMNSSTKFKTLLRQRRKQWPERDGVPISGEMVEMICSQVDGGEDFKRNFILFVVSAVLIGLFSKYGLSSVSSTLRGWTNDKIKSREEQEFEVGFGIGALEDRLDETEVPNEAQKVYEEEPSNATPEPAAEAEHDIKRSKIKALLKDAKKASNEIITNSRALAGVMTELEKLVPEAHASLKKIRMIAMQTTTEALFTETTLQGKLKSTTPVLSPDSCESKGFLLAIEVIKK